MTETAAPTAPAPAWATTYTAAALAALGGDVTTATPPQVDEVIRTVELEAQRLGVQIDRATDAVRKAIGHQETAERTGYGRARRTVTTWPTDWPTALAEARALPADTPGKARMAGYYGNPGTVGEALAAFDALIDTLREMKAIAGRCHDEFDRRGGWTRFYRVDNANGHVHTNTNCRTTFATTMWQWPTNLSGGDGAQVVEYAGALTCLVCFPDEREEILRDRPVRFDMFETPEQRDERIRREDAAAKLLADKIKKGVTPDGKVLVIELGPNRLTGFGRFLEIKTERAAELRYVELAALAQTRKTWITDDDKATAARGAAELVAALAWKQDTTAEAIIAKHAKKVEKKINAQY